MRVLWICNIMLPRIAQKLHRDYSVREGWLTGTLDRIISSGNDNIALAIAFPVTQADSEFHECLTLSDDEQSPFIVECFGFEENLQTPENYNIKLEVRFTQIMEQFKPDIVHIFGTEFPHSLAAAKVCPRKEKLLIGLQGIISECAKSYTADLPQKIVKHNTLRDFIKRDGIAAQQQKFFLRGRNEIETLKITGNVTGRTDFDKRMAETINPKVKYYTMNETMRAPFYADSWELPYCRKHRIFFSQADYPLKGFHYLLEAMPSILLHYPDTEIVVAGNSIVNYKTLKDKLKIGSYGAYIREYMNEWEISSKIEFLGKLTAEEMKEQYLLCHTFVCASSLENSPNSIAEAMLLGVPIVASRTGGIPSMVEDGRDGLLFTSGNSSELAGKIIHMWDSDDLCEQLAVTAYKKSHITHNPDTNFERLLAIYHQIAE